MIYPNVSLQDWLNVYKTLEVEHDSCEVCNRERHTTIPFIERDWVGLIAPECKCKQAGDLVVQVPRSAHAKELSSQLYKSLSEAPGDHK